MDAEAYADMLPWLVFLVVDRKSGLDVTWAAGCAGVCALGLLAWSYWRGLRSALPRIALGLFGAFFVLSLVDPWWDAGVGVPRTAAVTALCLATFASLHWTPLSEPYTSSLVAPRLRDDPRFRRVNVVITSAWGVGTALVAVACTTAALLQNSYAFTFLGWVTPLVLAGGTILWTARRWDLFRLAMEGDTAGTVSRGPIVSLVARHAELADEGHDAEIRPLRRQRDA